MEELLWTNFIIDFYDLASALHHSELKREKTIQHTSVRQRVRPSLDGRVLTASITAVSEVLGT